jgi:Co/Zn/Cd efflux system component
MTQLLGAGFSLLVLVGFSSWFLAEAAQAIAAPDEDAEDVDPWIVFGFALLGICFDGASLCAFYCWGASLLGDMDPETLNMGSAFMHVFSDSLRSITTLVESVLIFSFPEVSSATFDAWATLVVAGLVLVATVPPLIGWARSLGRCGRTVGYEALADVRDP